MLPLAAGHGVESCRRRGGLVGILPGDRRGVRSNGAQFTVATFAAYFLHDVEHHVWDVTAAGRAGD